MNVPMHFGYPYNTLQGYQNNTPRVLYHLPRVETNQKSKFKTDKNFKDLSLKSEIRFLGRKGMKLEERRQLFIDQCMKGDVDICFVAKGINIVLKIIPRIIDSKNVPEKVNLYSSFIMDGVCVRFQGWIDMNILDGVGYLEYDEERGMYEDQVLKEKIKRCHQKTRDNEERAKYSISQEMPRQEEYWENRNVC